MEDLKRNMDVYVKNMRVPEVAQDSRYQPAFMKLRRQIKVGIVNMLGKIVSNLKIKKRDAEYIEEIKQECRNCFQKACELIFQRLDDRAVLKMLHDFSEYVHKEFYRRYLEYVARRIDMEYA